jgi:hypothetical protein
MKLDGDVLAFLLELNFSLPDGITKVELITRPVLPGATSSQKISLATIVNALKPG